MERLKRLWFRYNMRVVAMILAVVTFLNVPLSSYASVSTPSDVDMEFMDKSGEGEYMPDNILSRYEESFEYCPEIVPNPNSRIAISSGAVAVFIALLAACGIYVGNNIDLVHQIISGFDSYLRRVAGNSKQTMMVWAAVLSCSWGEAVEDIKILIPHLRNYLKIFFTGYGTGELEYSFASGASALTNGPYSLPGIEYASKGYAYACSVNRIKDGENVIYDVFYNNSPSEMTPLCLYLNDGMLFVAAFANDRLYSNSAYVHSRTYVPADNAYKHSSGWVKGFLVTSSFYDDNDAYQIVANTSSLPVFKDQDYARSYVTYGAMDGLIAPDPDFTITVPNAWTQLQQDAFDRFGNTLTLPSTEEEWQVIQNQLASADTADKALGALSSVIDITGGGGVLPPISNTVAYDNLSYVVKILAGHCGANITQGQIDDFIAYYSGVTTGKLDKEALLENANIIVHNSIVINGGAPDPDDDERNNKYKVLKKLAVSLGAFLIGLGLVSDTPNFENNPTINNVQVVGDLPEVDPNPNPNPNPDSGVDLSGVIGLLQSILNVLKVWANPLSLMDSLVSKFGLPTLTDGIKSAISALPKLISGELTLPELFGNVTDAIFSMPQQVADAIVKALGLEKALENLGLKKLFDNVIELLPDALVDGFALPDLFADLGDIVNAVPKSISNLFGVVQGFSLPIALKEIGEKIAMLPSAIKDIIPPPPTVDTGVEDSDDDGFRKFVIALITLLLILVLLFILFLNLFIFIVSIFAIPSNTILFNEDVLRGLDFLKTVEIPIFNVSIYALLMGCVYFVVFMSIVTMLRKQINHIRIKG